MTGFEIGGTLLLTLVGLSSVVRSRPESLLSDPQYSQHQSRSSPRGDSPASHSIRGNCEDEGVVRFEGCVLGLAHVLEDDLDDVVGEATVRSPGGNVVQESHRGNEVDGSEATVRSPGSDVVLVQESHRGEVVNVVGSNQHES